MKKISITLFTFAFILVFAIGCKNNEVPTSNNTYKPEPFGTIPTKYYAGVVRNLKSVIDIGMIINDPIAQKQMAIWGKKDALGQAISLKYIFITMPTKGLWAMNELDDNYFPKSIRTSSGHLLEFSNFNESKKTFALKITEISSNKLAFEKNDVAICIFR